jgi:aminoglycoside phosphotransferase (APT) family kinase protein
MELCPFWLPPPHPWQLGPLPFRRVRNRLRCVPDPDIVLSILARHRLPETAPRLAPRQGIANETWIAGDWVVRLSKDPELLEDLYTESVAAPAAWRGGIRTPEVLAIALDPPETLPPYSVSAFIDGCPLADRESFSDPQSFFWRYGKEVRAVHSLPRPHDPKALLDESWEIDWEPLLQSAARLKVLPLVQRLRAEGDEEWTPCFVHQDLHAENVLVDHDENPVFIDWGDAGWGDPSADFRFIPVHYLESAFDGYGRVGPDLRRRVLVHQWDQFFYQQEEQKSYGPFGDSLLSDLTSVTEEFLGQI